MAPLETIDNILKDALPKISNIRQKIHQNPELGYEEYETTKLITKELNDLGLHVETKFSKTGAVGILKANGAQKTIALRADIDALSIKEETGIPFSSKNEGIMHACGHDVHTAIVFGVGAVLKKLQDKLKYNIKLIFQPAEECNPHGGAKTMIKNGVLQDVDAILGFHLWPSLSVGTIGVVKGSAMAASDRIKITILGKSGHAAEPHNSIDAINIAAQVINTINSFKTKNIDPFEPVVVSIGSICSQGRYNIVCPQVNLEGTVRTLNEDTRSFIKNELQQIIYDTVDSLGGRCEIDYVKGYDVLSNDNNLTEKFIANTKSLLGEDKVLTDIRPSMIAEDFSFYAKKVPATYFFLGCECPYPLHSSKFLPDERSIEIGIKTLSSFILNNDF